MFKHLFLIYSAAMCFGIGFSQNGPAPPESPVDKKFGLHLGLTSVENPIGVFSTVSLVLNQKKHSFYAGPTIWYSNDRIIGLPFKPYSSKTNGLQLAYKFRPGEKLHWYNGFLTYDFSYTSRQQYYWEYFSQNGQNFASEVNESKRYLANSVGVGVNFIFRNYFYIDNQIGGGFSLASTEEKVAVEGLPEATYAVSSSTNAPNIYFYFKVGLGWNIPDFSLFD